jgi:hypothetical protein
MTIDDIAIIALLVVSLAMSTAFIYAYLKYFYEIEGLEARQTVSEKKIKILEAKK